MKSADGVHESKPGLLPYVPVGVAPVISTINNISNSFLSYLAYCFKQGRPESPLPVKPRQRPAEPQHNYENHSISSPTSLTACQQTTPSSHYMNVKNSSTQPTPTTVNNNTDQGKKSITLCPVLIG